MGQLIKEQWPQKYQNTQPEELTKTGCFEICQTCIHKYIHMYLNICYVCILNQWWADYHVCLLRVLPGFRTRTQEHHQGCSLWASLRNPKTKRTKCSDKYSYFGTLYLHRFNSSNRLQPGIELLKGLERFSEFFFTVKAQHQVANSRFCQGAKKSGSWES